VDDGGRRILVFGEVLWDCFRDKQTLGGASLNFAVHASRLGHLPRMVSAVGDDSLGQAARERILASGLPDTWLQTTSAHATGRVTVAVDAAGQPQFTIHRPAAYDAVELTTAQLDELAAWNPDWLYYGTLSSMVPHSREILLRLMAALPRARRFYDINLRRDSYTTELVGDLMARAGVVKLNLEEMRTIGSLWRLPTGGIEEFCRAGAARYGWQAVAVTLGEQGCALWIDGQYAQADGVPVKVADTVGSGDAFAAAFVHGLSLGWPPREIAVVANKVGAMVATRPGGTPDWTVGEALQLGAER
jgi:fructokinase